MRTKLEFNNKCTACGAARRKEDLTYSKEELKPFCTNINMCNADHPNSYTNVLTNGGVVAEMLNFKDAQAKFTEQLMAEATEEEKQVIKMMQSPTTLRIEEFDLAQHIIKYKEEHRIGTITDTFRDMIREHMNIVRKLEERNKAEQFVTPIISEPEEEPPYTAEEVAKEEEVLEEQPFIEKF